MIYYSKETLIKYYKEYKKRFDGREANQYRKIDIKKDVIKTAEGSSLVRLGNTLVIAGIKVEVGELFEEGKGNFIVNIDFPPIAHQSFIAGPPDERAIEISRVVDRGFRSAQVLDLEKLALEPKKGYTVFLDMYVLDYDGNSIDACYLAGMAAIMNIKIPVFDGEKLDRTKYLQENFVKNMVVSNTFAKIDNYILLDPDYTESEISDNILSIAIDKNENIVGVQKIGLGEIKEKELDEMIESTIKNKEFLLKLLKI